MSKYLMAVPFQVGLGPVLPPMDATEGNETHITYLVNGERKGGYNVVGHVPQATTCIVLLDSTAQTVAAIEAAGNGVLLEEVIDNATI